MTGNEKLVKTNVAGIYKNTDTGLLINNNIHELETYRLRIAQNKREKDLERRVRLLELRLEKLIEQLK